MKELPKHLLVSIIALVVIGLLGGGAWFWSAQLLSSKINEKAAIQGQLMALEKKGIFPSAQNKKTLDEQAKELATLSEGMEPSIQQRMALFKDVRTVDDAGLMKGLGPDEWKKLFEEKRNALRKMAEDKKVKIPDDFNFGFSSYVLAAPRLEHTLDLGVQLMAVQEFSKALIQSGAQELLLVRRAMVENKEAESRSTTSRTSSSGNEEAVEARVVTEPNGVYRVIPFEIVFKASPQSLVTLLNTLGSSPFLFVTKNLVLENEKTTVPKRSEVMDAASAEATTSGAEAKPTTKVLIPVVGQELVTVRLRIDLIDFLPPTKSQVVPKKT